MSLTVGIGSRTACWDWRTSCDSSIGERGVYLCDIAEQLGVHPRTVRRAVRRGGAPAPRRGRAGVARPVPGTGDQLLSEGVWNAVVLLRELQGGVHGRDLDPRDYVLPKRPAQSRATVRFETERAGSCRRLGRARTVLAGEASRCTSP